MVGKPNIPLDCENRNDLKGAAMTTPGLNALDQEREASMADEGGCSGALMENQDEMDPRVLDEVCHPKKSQSSQNRVYTLGIILGLSGLIVAGLMYYLNRKQISSNRKAA